MGSIIGSGWLFGAQKGLIAAGPAASSPGSSAASASWSSPWCTPSSARCTRCPAVPPLPALRLRRHRRRRLRLVLLAQAVTVAPIEVSAMILYPGHYSWANELAQQGRDADHAGLVVAGRPDGPPGRGELPRRQGAGQHQQRADLVEGRRARWPTILIVALFGSLHGSNFTPPTASTPTASRASCSPIPASGIIFAYLGFEQADQLAGESKNPKRDIPFAVIGVDHHRPDHLHPAAGGVPARPSPASAIGKDLGRDRPAASTRRSPARGRSWPRWSASAGWRRSCTSTP